MTTQTTPPGRFSNNGMFNQMITETIQTVNERFDPAASVQTRLHEANSLLLSRLLDLLVNVGTISESDREMEMVRLYRSLRLI